MKREEAFYYKNLLMLGVFLLKCGDLRLHWGGEDLPKLNAKPPLCYIGQSVKAERRKKERGAPWRYAMTYSRGANVISRLPRGDPHRGCGVFSPRGREYGRNGGGRRSRRRGTMQRHIRGARIWKTGPLRFAPKRTHQPVGIKTDYLRRKR